MNTSLVIQGVSSNTLTNYNNVPHTMLMLTLSTSDVYHILPVSIILYTVHSLTVSTSLPSVNGDKWHIYTTTSRYTGIIKMRFQDDSRIEHLDHTRLYSINPNT